MSPLGNKEGRPKSCFKLGPALGVSLGLLFAAEGVEVAELSFIFETEALAVPLAVAVPVADMRDAEVVFGALVVVFSFPAASQYDNCCDSAICISAFYPTQG
jgi:hypothetical protein